MKGIFPFLPALLVCIAGCKKTPKNSEPLPLFGEPVVTAKGQAVGTAVTKQIDAAGGALTSQDGKFTPALTSNVVRHVLNGIRRVY